MQRCEMAEEAKRAAEVRYENLRAAQIPVVYEAADFDKSGLGSIEPSQRAQIENAIDTCRRFVAKPDSHSLILMGTVGAGKSYIAAAGLREFIRQHGRTGLFWNWIGRWGELRRLRAHNRHPDAEDLLQLAQTVGLLVLDDLGKNSLDRTQQDRLYEIVDERYVNKRPWIVTTNSNRRELESKLSLGVVDRLFDTHRSLIATLTGTSWRQ